MIYLCACCFVTFVDRLHEFLACGIWPNITSLHDFHMLIFLCFFLAFMLTYLHFISVISQ